MKLPSTVGASQPRRRQRRPRPSLHRAMGLSLLECLLALAMTALLAAMSLPLESGAWQRSQRGLARQALMQAAAWVEREQTLVTTAVAQLPDPAPWGEGLSYALVLTRIGDGYVLRATPQGRQTSDACGVMWLSDTGARGADGKACW
jgi:type IV pilus assembly protein PilE